jgi:hypothetical protein
VTITRVVAGLLTTVSLLNACSRLGKRVSVGEDEAFAKGRGIPDCSPVDATRVALRFTRAWNNGDETGVAKMVAERAIIGIGSLPGQNRAPIGPQQAVELLRERHKHREHIDLIELTVNGAHRPPAVPTEVNIVFRFTVRADDLDRQSLQGKGALGCEGVITRWAGGPRRD